VNSLHKTVTRQRRGCDLNPGSSAPESSTITTRLPSRPLGECGRIMDDRQCRIGQIKTTVCVEKFKISFDFFVINTGI